VVTMWFYFWFLVNTSILMFISLLAIGALDKLGVFKKISVLSMPIVRFFRLPKELAPLIAVAMASPVGAYVMLAKQSQVNMAALFLIAPFGFLHDIVRFFIPTALSALGPVAMYYIALMMLKFFVYTTLCFATAKLYLRSNAPLLIETRHERVSWRAVFRNAIRIWSKVTIRMAAITAIIAVLDGAGVFKVLGVFLNSLFTLSGAGAVILTAATVNSLSAMYMAGAFLARGEVAVKEALVALFAGQLISTPLVHFRIQLPQRIGLFGVKIAVIFTIYTLIFSELATIAVLMVLLMLFR
jgi:hypothetical protein